MEVKNLYSLRNIVLQPTTNCNLNCKYCYLPDREKNIRMPISVATKIAHDIENLDNHIYVLWHAGEPLAAGYEHFTELVNQFESLRTKGKIDHIIQTNATLINDKWCKLFKDYNFHVGISIDGPEELNSNRVNWGNKSTYNKTMKGIQYLKDNDIEFSAIAVINEVNIDKVEDFYKFFCELGCSSLGVNIEEMEGINLKTYSNKNKIAIFWEKLFKLWTANPKFGIREFNRALSWMESYIEKKSWAPIDFTHDIFPTITNTGNVFMLSPEFNGAISEKYNNFVAGNVLNDSLLDLVENSYKLDYVIDFQKGNKTCKSECEYYSVCLGGQASNKFFENKSLDSTETAACKNTQQAVVNMLLNII
jgi:uncharacterized protein